MTTTEPAMSRPEPEAPARWGFWGTSLLGLLIGILFVVTQSIAFMFGVVVQGVGLSDADMAASFEGAAENGTLVSGATLLTMLLGCAMVVWAVKLKQGAVLTDYLALGPVPRAVVVKWLGLTAAFVLVSDLTTMAIGRPVVPPFMTELYASAQPAWLLWLALIVGAPVFEETFFRGFLLPGFAASFLKPAGAVVVTAILWAALHLQYDAYGIVTVFLIGLLFGAARVKTGSLWVPLALHAMVNLIATVQAAVSG